MLFFLISFQDPIPSLDDYLISQYSLPKPALKAIGRNPVCRYITTVFPVVECGAPKTKSRIKDLITTQAQKRQAEMILIENHPSPPKKLKKVSN
jgi:hypothetical protein